MIKKEYQFGNKIYNIKSFNNNEILLETNNVHNWVSKKDFVKSLSKIQFNNTLFENNNHYILLEDNNTKIIAKDTQPIYYHGSPSKSITEFDTNVIFWTTDLEFAESFGKYIYQAHLTMNKIFDITNMGCFNVLLEYEDGVLYENDYDDDLNPSGKKLYKSYTEFLKSNPFHNSWEITENYLYSIQSLGYDAIKVFEEGTENYAVFNNNQIKLLGTPTPRRLVDNFNIDNHSEIIIQNNNDTYKKVYNCSKEEALLEFFNDFTYYNELTPSNLDNNGFIFENIFYATQWKDDFGKDVFFTIEKNPSKKEFWDAIKNSKSKKLRGILGVDKWSNLYVWDAYYGTHDDIYNHYLRGDDKLRKGFAQLYMDKDGIRTFGFSADSGRIKEKYYSQEIESNKSSEKMKAIFADDEFGLLKESSKQYIDEDYIDEDLDDVKKYYPNINNEIIQKLVSLDPTYKGNNFAGKYTKWLLRIYNNALKEKKNYEKWLNQQKQGKNYPEPSDNFKNIKEELKSVKPLLNTFHKMSKKLKKNIDDFKTIGDLKDFIKNNINSDNFNENNDIQKGLDLIQKSISKGGEVVFKNNNWVVLIPKTLESSCVFGNDTNWCTTTPNGRAFTYYTNLKDSKLFINFNKQTGEFYQFHFELEEFKDKNDNDVDFVNIIKNDNELTNYYTEYLYNNYNYANKFQLLTKIKPDLINSEKEQLQAIENNPNNYYNIKNPTLNTQKKMLEIEPTLIEEIPNPNKELMLTAVNYNPDVIALIQNPPEDVIIFALKKDPSVYEYIKNPSEQVKQFVQNMGYVSESRQLNEGIAAVKKYYPKIDSDKINELIALDPTYKGGDELGKYGKWILNLYNNFLKDKIAFQKWEEQKKLGQNYPEPIRKSQEQIEDFQKIPNLLKDFDVINQTAKINIDTIKSTSDLYKIVNDAKNQGVSTNSKVNYAINLVKKSVSKGGKVVFKDSNWIVLVPETLESSVVFGDDTNWCTTTPNGEMYNYYKDEDGGQYFINVNLQDGSLYQFHFESEQFMDKNDNEISIRKLIDKDGQLKKFYLSYLYDNYKSNKKLGQFIFQLDDNPSEEFQLAAVKQNGLAIKYINNPSKKVQLAAVKQEGYAIRYIKNPSEELQLTAVKQNGLAIQDINNPSEELQLTAVKQNGWAIKYINNPSEKVQLEAVKEDYYAIQDIKNPSEQVQIEVVKQNRYAIQYIDNPSEKVQLAAVKQNRYAIQYIDNPSEKVQLAAVKQDGHAIQDINNPSEKVQLEAVKQNGDVIRYIKNPSEQVQLEAVKQDSFAIYYIDNPSEQVQLEAVKQDGWAIKYIENPTKKVKQLAKKLAQKDSINESRQLNEGIEEIKKYYPKIDSQKINELVRLDPTYRGGNELGKYGKWILNLYNKGNLKEEDFYKVTEYLTTFKNNLSKIDVKDIMKYKSLPDLAEKISQFEGQKDISKREELKYIKSNEAEKVFENNNYIVIVPLTHRASCYYGANTKWCTTAENSSWFDEYNSKGRLFIIINKKTNKKYQFHFETLSFMDELDREINPSEIISNDNKLFNWFCNQVNDKLEVIIENYNEEHYNQIEYGGYTGYSVNVGVETFLYNCVEFEDDTEDMKKMIIEYIDTYSIDTFSRNLIRKLFKSNEEFANKCNNLVKKYSPNDYYLKHVAGKESGLFIDKEYKSNLYRIISNQVWDKVIEPLWKKINEEVISFEIDDNRIMIDIEKSELVESLYSYGDFEVVFSKIDRCEPIEFSSLNITSFDFITKIVYSSIKEWFTGNDDQLEIKF